MVTAENITHAQIRDLWDALIAEDIRSITGADVRECKIALGIWPEVTTRITRARIREARANVASILNARASKTGGAL